MQPTGILEDLDRWCHSLKSLHLEALNFLEQSPGETAFSNQMAFFLSCHAANLLDVQWQLVVNGRLDVASYLLRPAWDVGWLIVAVASDEDVAQAFAEGREVKSKVGRDTVIRALESSGYADLAARLDGSLKSDYRPLQDLAHASMVKVSKLLHPSDDGDHVAVLGQRDSIDESVRLFRAILKNEIQMLVCLYAVRGAVFQPTWGRQLECVHEEFYASLSTH